MTAMNQNLSQGMTQNRPSNASILQSQDLNQMNMTANPMAQMQNNMFNKKQEGNVGFDNSTITQKIDDMFTKEEDDLDQFYKNYSKSPIRSSMNSRAGANMQGGNMNRFNSNMGMD